MKEITRKFKSEMGISGEVEIKKRDIRTGEIVEERKGNNLLLDSYLNGYFEDGIPLLNEYIFYICELGDDDTPADRSQTGLQGTELASKERNSYDGALELWKQGWSQRNNFTGHSSFVHSVNFHPTIDNLAISGSQDDTVKIFEFDTDEGTTNELCSFTGHNSWVYSVNFHPTIDNLAISSSSNDTVKIWEFDIDEGTTNELCSFEEHNDSIYSANFHPTIDNLAISGSWDEEVKIWEFDTETETTTELCSFTEHSDFVTSVNFHPTIDNLAISSSNDDTVKIWEFDTDEGTTNELCSFTGHSSIVEFVNFHPTIDNLAISSSRDDTVKIWEFDTDEGTTNELCSFEEHSNIVTSVNFHPTIDNLAISGSEDDTVKIFEFDIDEGITNELCSFTEHSDFVTSVNFHPTIDNLAISGSRDDEVKIIKTLLDKKNEISASAEWTFEAGEGTGTIREIYLQADNHSNYNSKPVARKVISPEIEKDEYHEIIVKWTIKVTKPDSAWTGTLTGAGMNEEDIDYELTMGNKSLYEHTAELSHLMDRIYDESTGSVHLRTFESNTELFEDSRSTGDNFIDEIHRGDTYQIVKTYSASDYKMEFRLTLDVDDSNDADIGGVRVEQNSDQPYFRTLFDPKLEKTDTYRIHFDYEFQLNPS